MSGLFTCILPRILDLVKLTILPSGKRFFYYIHVLNLPKLSGSFMFLRSSLLRETGCFDEKFFMYLEDVDLTRRIHRIAPTVFYPFASITHEHQRGSYNSKKLLLYHMSSA